ncbi:hypothetical protein HDU99_003082, partial [Rhizoclosmatium hyalinum]
MTLSAQKPAIDMLDLVVIGAGPHSLSLLCRLLEQSPFETLTDSDHQRYHHIRTKSKNKLVRDCCDTIDVDSLKPRIKVIDANVSSGGWMCQWNKSFEALHIAHLRSPMFFHPDPFHPDALRTFAKAECRECELLDITACFESGCKKCKKTKQRSHFIANDRRQFFTPSASLFQDFCSSLVDRYGLDDVLHQGNVTAITPVNPNTPNSYFEIKSFNKYTGEYETFTAKRVVAALGNVNNPIIPPWVHMIPQHIPEKRIVHALDFVQCLKSDCEGCNDDILPDQLKEQLNDLSEKPRLLVIGGGLTSAQLVQLAVKRGFKDITLMTRGVLKTSQFDLSLDWIGRNANTLFASFWQAPLAERRAILRRAKNGGSVTPEYMALLKCYKETGVLEIKEKQEVRQADWNSRDKKWRVLMSTCEYEEYDVIWLGTGAALDVKKEACLAPVLESDPIEVVGGLPALDRNLKWGDLDLYMMSGYCGLSLGPTAGNLIGGRVAAERIAGDLWKKWVDESEELRSVSEGA